jgi:hypothetical protein
MLAFCHGELEKHPEYYSDCLYTMVVKSASEKARRARMLQYTGPDPGTLQLLQDHLDLWTQDPGSFWSHGAPEALDQEPLIHMAMRYSRFRQIGP